MTFLSVDTTVTRPQGRSSTGILGVELTKETPPFLHWKFYNRAVQHLGLINNELSDIETSPIEILYAATAVYF